MRATLPAGYSIWSTVVGAKPMKPAVDAEGRVMVPLNKSQGSGKQVRIGLDWIFTNSVIQY
jgi:hypothetical protein